MTALLTRDARRPVRDPNSLVGSVNCTDCASIVTAFANSVGCNLHAGVMASASVGPFTCNEIQAIGYATWARPFLPGGQFSYHEVAWTGTGGASDPLFDACLNEDGGSNPWGIGTPHTTLLPVNIPFTTLALSPSLPLPTPFTASSYRERLATNDSAGIGSCIPLGPQPHSQLGRRKVI